MYPFLTTCVDIIMSEHGNRQTDGHFNNPTPNPAQEVQIKLV